MTLVREDTTSLYEQIAATLQTEIEQGTYEPSGKLPSESELGQRFDVSRVTVRLAIAQLVDAKLVERKQGKGTFTTSKRLQHRLDVLHGFYDSLVTLGKKPRMQLLQMETRAVPTDLKVVFKSQTQCTYLARLHLVDEHPVALAQTYMLPQAASISREQAAVTPSYDMLESLLGWKIVSADMAITAIAAPLDIAQILQITVGSPLLIMKRISQLADGQIGESTTLYIRPEHYEFVVSSKNAKQVAGRAFNT